MLWHLNTPTATRPVVVQDDADRFALVACIASALGERLLAWCVMNTHLHACAEGRDAPDAFWSALARYTQMFNARYTLGGPLWSKRATPLEVGDEAYLANAVSYVHDNPVKAGIVTDPSHYLWSSARAYRGLSWATFPNVERCRQLLGRRASKVIVSHPLVDDGPVAVPTASPGLILAAASQACFVAPELAASGSLDERASLTRRVYVALGRLEGYRDRQLGPAVGRTRSMITRLRAKPPEAAPVLIARTLLAVPEIRRGLQVCAPEAVRKVRTRVVGATTGA